MFTLLRIFLDHLVSIFGKKPKVSWLFQAPLGPLILCYGFTKRDVLLNFLRLWQKALVVAVGISAVVLSLLSLAELIAWAHYLLFGKRVVMSNELPVKPHAPTPDGPSESN